MAAEKRYRNFATVVYPESAPENWIDILRELKIPCFISPLHDKDKYTDKDIKKAHYHVEYIFEGVKSKSQVEEINNKIGGVGCEIVNSARAYARYLCHLDDPDKYQYDISQVIALGGLSYRPLIGSMADKNMCISQMIDHINKYDVISFADLVIYAKDEKSEWFDCLINSGSYFIKEYIKSRCWKLHIFEEK